MLEAFAPNRAIAVCTNKDVTFECMMGKNVDVDNVIIDVTGADCDNDAGYTTATVAQHNAYNDSGWMGHSHGESGGSWSFTTNTGWKYTAPTGAKGLLYICNNNGYDTSKWSVSNGVLSHSKSHTGKWHCQVAPIFSDPVTEVGVAS